MSYHHENSSVRWQQMSLYEQMGNIGSEVCRAFLFLERKETVSLNNSRLRVLELLDMTLKDSRWMQESKFHELIRLREILIDSLFEKNMYKNTPEMLKTYFLSFAIMARKNAG